jgi:hypothetical protein
MARISSTFKIASTKQISRVPLSVLLAGCLALPVLSSSALGLLGDIRIIDFANFSYPVERQWLQCPPPESWYWLPSIPRDTVALKNGRYVFESSEYEGDPTPPSLSLRSVVYGDLDGDGMEEAAVDLRFGTGGTASWDYVYVHSLARDTARSVRLLGILESGSRADGGLVGSAIKGKLLILDFFDSSHRVADCCSSRAIRVHYRFRKGKFAEEGTRKGIEAPLSVGR